MYRQVGHAFISASHDLSVDECRRQSAVAVFSGNIVRPHPRRLHSIDQQAKLGAAGHDPRAQNRAVFVAVARIEMRHQAVVILFPDRDIACRFALHSTFSRKSRIFRNLATAVCPEFWIRLFRREIWIAGRPQKLCPTVIGASKALPSRRRTAASMNTG